MPSTINLQNVQIKNGSTWYTMCPFPVGYIYLSSNSTSPANIYGGTWSALNEDRFLRPSNAWTTGGNRYIAVNQLPAHSHTLRNTYDNTGIGFWQTNADAGNLWYALTRQSSGAVFNLAINNTGGGKEYWPQYRDCYAWYRTA